MTLGTLYLNFLPHNLEGHHLLSTYHTPHFTCFFKDIAFMLVPWDNTRDKEMGQEIKRRRGNDLVATTVKQP